MTVRSCYEFEKVRLACFQSESAWAPRICGPERSLTISAPDSRIEGTSSKQDIERIVAGAQIPSVRECNPLPEHFDFGLHA